MVSDRFFFVFQSRCESDFFRIDWLQLTLENISLASTMPPDKPKPKRKPKPKAVAKPKKVPKSSDPMVAAVFAKPKPPAARVNYKVKLKFQLVCREEFMSVCFLAKKLNSILILLVGRFGFIGYRGWWLCADTKENPCTASSSPEEESAEESNQSRKSNQVWNKWF